MRPKGVAWRLRESQPFLTSLGVLVVIIVVSSAALPHFRSLGNMKNLLLQAVALGIVCIGQTFPIILAGIDLSVGAVINMSMCLTAGLSKGHGELLVPVVVLVVLIALLIGFINGFVIARTGVHPLIVTLGMMSVVQGALLLYTKVPVGPVPESFYFFAWADVFGVPFPFLLLCALAVVAMFVLRKTSFGRYIYAAGGNEEVARLSGIPIAWIKIGTYMVCSVAAAIAGIFLASRLGSPGPLAGENFMLDSITPVILGGTSLSGGIGGVGGTIAGSIHHDPPEQCTQSHRRPILLAVGCFWPDFNLCTEHLVESEKTIKEGSMSKKVKIAIVGLHFGKEFIPIYQRHPEVEVCAVCQRTKKDLDKVGDEFGIAKRYTRFEDVLRDKDVDAVHLATPIADHAAMTLAAFEAGKHTACAVPMATTKQECFKIIEARKKAKKVYMMLETHVYTLGHSFTRKNLLTAESWGRFSS